MYVGDILTCRDMLSSTSSLEVGRLVFGCPRGRESLCVSGRLVSGRMYVVGYGRRKPKEGVVGNGYWAKGWGCCDEVDMWM